MSRKNKKKNAAADAAPVKEKRSFKEFLGANKKALIIAISAVLLLAFVIGLVAVIINSFEFDYLTSDLSRYITIKESDYKPFPVVMITDEIDDADVQRAIYKLLVENKSDEAKYDGATVLNMPISLGDTVYIYYRGYMLDEDGEEVDFSGGCNFSSSSETKLEIGSGTFIEGFEESLIGVVPNTLTRFEKITSGNVSSDMVVYLSGSVLYPNGSAKQSFTSTRVDLSDPNVNEFWGNGFREYLIGAADSAGNVNTAKEIGKTLDSKTFSHEDGAVVYYDLKVDFATRCEGNPLTVQAKFPIGYSEESLRGKEAFFDVYIRGAVIYDVPEYNEEFIRETLKVSAEDLAEYEGETVVEKHTAMLRAQLEAELEESRRSVIEDALWAHLHEVANIKKLPESEVKIYYAQYYDEVQAAYSTYSQAYASVDAFAEAYFGLDKDTDWRDYIMSRAKDVVAEKLMFHCIIRQEGFIPPAEEYDRIYNEQISEHLEYYTEKLYKDELDKITDPEKKAARIAEIKKEMLDYYGNEYFRENVYYIYAADKIFAFAQITEE